MTLYDIEVLDGMNAAEIRHQIDRLNANALFQEALGDLFQTERKRAANALREDLMARHHRAHEAERFQAASLPPGASPEQARALLDKWMADPRFRAVLNSPENPAFERVVEFQEQLVTWANPPAQVAQSIDTMAGPVTGAADGMEGGE